MISSFAWIVYCANARVMGLSAVKDISRSAEVVASDETRRSYRRTNSYHGFSIAGKRLCISASAACVVAELMGAGHR
jgi:hypothetical protein